MLRTGANKAEAAMANISAEVTAQTMIDECLMGDMS
jgi:hypothetical protein